MITFSMYFFSDLDLFFGFILGFQSESKTSLVVFSLLLSLQASCILQQERNLVDTPGGYTWWMVCLNGFVLVSPSCSVLTLQQQVRLSSFSYVSMVELLATSRPANVLSNGLWDLTDYPRPSPPRTPPYPKSSRPDESITATGWISVQTPHYLLGRTHISSNWFDKCGREQWETRGRGDAATVVNCALIGSHWLQLCFQKDPAQLW